MTQNEKKEFTFINEQIKKKPLYRRNWFLKTVAGILLAAVFGAAAGLTFAVVRPWAEMQFGEPDEPTQIVVVQEETEKETEAEPAQTETEAESEVSGEKDAAQLDISSYKELYEQMNEVAKAALASMVKVDVYVTEMDWFNKEYEGMSEASGLILSMDSQRLYILTSSKVVQNAQQVVVTFENGDSVEAFVRQEDKVTEMTVLEVPVRSLKKKTKKNIETISMKGVADVAMGQPVIAVGSPLGYTDSLAFGMITSVTECQSTDSEFGVISTDIIGNENSYGVLLNLDGDIVGIVSQKFDQRTEQNTISALQISDMNDLLELLISNQSIPYLGIVGKEVGESAAERFKIPGGVYVKQVEADSPAMYAGIQTADIVTAIDGQQIRTIRQYEDILKQHQEGDVLTVALSRKGLDGYAQMEIKVTVGAR